MPLARENKKNRDDQRLEKRLSVLQLTQQQTVSYTGPIPAPDTLERYGQLDSSLVNRIVAMAEHESSHRRQLETKVLDANIADMQYDRAIESRGQSFAFIVAITTILVGGALIYSGHAITGSIFGAGSILSLVGAFIYGRSKTPGQKQRAAEQASTAIQKP